MKFESVELKNLIGYLQEKYLDFYAEPLSKLKQSFQVFYMLLKGIIEQLRSILDIIEGKDQNGVDLLHNCLNLIKSYFDDARPIDYTFCVSFIQNSNEFIHTFILHFHQIYHIELESKSDEKKIKKTFYSVENVLQKIGSTITDVKNQFEKVEHVLVHIFDSLRNFKSMVDYLLREFTSLDCGFTSENYINSFNECFKLIHGDHENHIKGDLLKKMINLMKDFCLNQLEMEKLLDLPIKVSHTIKDRNYKIDIPPNFLLSQQVINKYVG